MSAKKTLGTCKASTRAPHSRLLALEGGGGGGRGYFLLRPQCLRCKPLHIYFVATAIAVKIEVLICMLHNSTSVAFAMEIV